MKSLSPDAANLTPGAKTVQRYAIPDASLSAIFSALLAHQAALGVEDFSVSQTTLEDVFLEFAKQQE